MTITKLSALCVICDKTGQSIYQDRSVDKYFLNKVDIAALTSEAREGMYKLKAYIDEGVITHDFEVKKYGKLQYHCSIFE